MNDLVKGMLLMLVVVYLISPIDLFPGAVDDLIVMICYSVIQKSILTDEN